MADDAIEGCPAMLAGIEPMKQKGFFIRNSKNFVVNNVTVVGVDGNAFELENCKDVVFSNCKMKNSRNENAKLIEQVGSKDCVVK